MFRDKKLFIFDLDGVMYRNDDPIPSALEAVKFLRKMGKIVIFQTNNATKTPEEVAKKLTRMGLSTLPSEIYTSAIIASQYLAMQYPHATIYTVGEPGLKIVFKNAGFIILNDEQPDVENLKKIPSEIRVDFVIVALDSGVTYNRLRVAMMLIQNGAEFFATNDDSNFPASGTFWPGAGAIVAFLQAALQRPPKKIFGKPHPEGLLGILEKLQISPNEAVFIGDRLNTDILGGNRVGLTTVLVETGINTREEIKNVGPDQHPHYVYSSLVELIREHFS
jgi:4-nitrophenyl phosphatase